MEGSLDVREDTGDGEAGTDIRGESNLELRKTSKAKLFAMNRKSLTK